MIERSGDALPVDFCSIRLPEATHRSTGEDIKIPVPRSHKTAETAGGEIPKPRRTKVLVTATAARFILCHSLMGKNQQGARDSKEASAGMSSTHVVPSRTNPRG